MNVELSKYDNSFYRPGKNFLVRIIWYYTNLIFLNSSWLPFSKLKIFILKFFGAKIEKGLVIRHKVNIKYPWHLKIGKNVWIGENVWIDNLDDVIIGNDVVISQGALLLCGNHNYKKSTFDLITRPIRLENGVWIGAKSIVTSGVTCKSHSVLSVASVATNDLDSFGIYRGNPALFVKKRIVN